MLKTVSILLIQVILFFNNGIKYSIDYCCDVVSKISISFTENHIETGKDCCSCLNKKEQSCCKSSQVETEINQGLINNGIEKIKLEPSITYIKEKVRLEILSNFIFIKEDVNNLNLFKFNNSIRLIKQVFNI